MSDISIVKICFLTVSVKVQPTCLSFVIIAFGQIPPVYLSVAILIPIALSYVISVKMYFQPKPVKGLQNCLFQSILHQLSNVPEGYEAKHLRRQVIRELAVNRDTYSVSLKDLYYIKLSTITNQTSVTFPILKIFLNFRKY